MLERVAAGKKIWEFAGRAVLDPGEGVILKAGDDLDPDEASSMRFLENHAPALPAPRCLGLLTISRRSLLFMTKVPGDTLESRWTNLSAQSKTDIQQSRHLCPAEHRQTRGATLWILVGEMQGHQVIGSLHRFASL